MSLPNKASKDQSSSGSLSSKSLSNLEPAKGKEVKRQEDSRVNRANSDRPRPQSRR